jgi:hypothetical protein
MGAFATRSSPSSHALTRDRHPLAEPTNVSLAAGAGLHHPVRAVLLSPLVLLA